MTQRHEDVRTVRRLQAVALEHGAQVTRPGVVKWDAAGRCESPYYVERVGRSSAHPTEFHKVLGDAKHKGLAAIDMRVACRKCPACLRKRAALWRYRAEQEINRSSRTWFGTITLRPDQHYLMMCRAAVRLRGRGVAFDELGSAEQFEARHTEIAREITLWLKRVRKNSGAKLRYILVAEAHKTGLPHYHMLLHEMSPLHPIRHRILAEGWHLGFSNFKLVPTDDASRKVAGYVCKYLTKSASARVRASERYGQLRSVNIGQQLEMIRDHSQSKTIGAVLTAPPKALNSLEFSLDAPDKGGTTTSRGSLKGPEL